MKGDKVDMGMTDSQFKSFIRFLADALQEARDEENVDKKNQKLEKILSNLQAGLED